jgi:hypothetical protein
MVTFLAGVPDEEPTPSIFLTICSPSNTLPNTTCRPSNHAVLIVVMKNCEPFVPGPATSKVYVTRGENGKSEFRNCI